MSEAVAQPPKERLASARSEEHDGSTVGAKSSDLKLGDDDLEGTFVGVVDLRALSSKLGVSEASLHSSIFEAAPFRPSAAAERLSESPFHDGAMPGALLGSAAMPDEEVGQELALPRSDVADVALVTAARRVASVGKEGPPELLKVDGRTVLVHSLLCLEQAGVRVAVVLLAAHAEELIAAVAREFQAVDASQRHVRMRIEFIDLGEGWSGSHADSILRARGKLADLCGGALFPRPFLLLASDRVYEAKLLRGLVSLPGPLGSGTDSICVVDDPASDQVAPAARPATAVRVFVEESAPVDGAFRVEQVGRLLPIYNGIEVGLFRLNGHEFFSEMESIQALREKGETLDLVGPKLTVMEVLDGLAAKKRLLALPVGGLKYSSFETPDQIEMSMEQDSDLYLPAPSPSSQPAEEFAAYTVEERAEDHGPLPRVAIIPVQEEGGASEAMDGVSHAALLPSSFDPTVRRLANEEDLLVVVENPDGEGGLPETALLLPARLEAEVEADDAQSGDVMCSIGLPSRALQMLEAQVGIDMPSDVTGLHFSVREGGEESSTGDRTERALVATVERQVPLIGWIILLVATLTQSSSVLVIKKSTPGVPEGVIQAWRYLAATLAASPVVVLNAMHRLANDRASASTTNAQVEHLAAPTETTPLLSSPKSGPGPPPKSPARRTSRPVEAVSKSSTCQDTSETGSAIGSSAKAALLGCVVSFWMCSCVFMIAIRTSSRPELVQLFSNLAPLVIVLARMTRLFPGGFPHAAELSGCVVALVGAAICALSRGKPGGAPHHDSDEDEAASARWMAEGYAIICSLLASALHAVYAVLTKVARAEISAPTIHICMEGGSAVLAVLTLMLTEELHLSFDPQKGVFGFLHPSSSRLLAWMWMGVGVDTLGTLGYTAAMKYVNPLMVVMAGLLQVGWHHSAPCQPEGGGLTRA